MQLFGEYGLVVIDADCRNLKSQFIPIVKNELMNSPTVGLVNATSANLNVAYNSQIVPRDINLFYLDGDVRERIVKSDEGEYLVLNTNLKFSKSEIVSLVEANPEKFSPNVALRPVYQERILPNLAYIGGPGEISYWLQLLSTFDHFEVAFPMLVVRNHALIIQDKSLQKFESLGFSLADLFCSVDELTKKYIQKHESSKIDFDSFARDLDSLFKSLGESMAVVDATLLGATQAELQKSKNGIVLLEKKYQAALKRKNEVAINQIKGILEKAFPDDSPQERRSNYYGFPSDVRSTLINQALNSFRTFENELTIFVS
jgi:bacillithiol biosynthesis cysteine-adding enzyme BshC